MHLRALKKLPTSQLRAEARLAGRLEDLFQGVAERTVRELADRQRLPTDDASIRRITAHILNASEDYQEILAEEGVDAAQYGRNRVVSELQRAGMSIVFSEFSDRVSNLIRNGAFEASEYTISRVIGNVTANLADSYDAGLGIDDAASNLQEVFDGLQDYELKRVARTEINSFQNEGAFLTEQELGVEYHQWYTAEDERVRDRHVDVHGEIVRVGEPFSNGLLRPGDKMGVIEEWINCRCRAVPFLMPEGKMAPVGRGYFYESDLVDIA